MKGLLLFVNINFILFFLFQSTFAQTNQTVTNGSTTSSINFPGAGCIYNWVNDTPGIGLAAGGTGNIPSFTAVNTGAVPVTAIITGLPINMGPACNGTLITFSITVNPSVAATITASNATGTISACAGTASASPNIQQFTVTGSGLTGNITATAPTGFEVSLSSTSGYGSSVILSHAGDSVTNTVVYVRSAASAPAGSISGNVVLSSTGATSQNVAVTGTVNALLTVNSVPNQTVNNAVSTTPINFTGTANAFNWVNDTPGIGLAASGTGNIPSFTAINTGGSPIKATITVTPVIPAGYAYINNVDDNNVSVINSTTNTVVATVPVGTQPIGIAVTPDGSKVYITNSGSNNVSVISTQTNTVIATITVGAYPYSAAISPDGSLAYIANLNSGSISIINTTTNTVKATVQVGTYAYYIAQNADGSRLYIADNTDSLVYVFDTATNTVIAAIKCPEQPYGLCVSNDGTKVYAANNSAYSTNIMVISTVTNTVVSSILTDRQPEAIVESPDGKWLYVADANSADVSVIDLSTNLLTLNILVGDGPQSLSITADGRYLYVVNSAVNSRNVSVIDTKTNTVIAEVQVGDAPISFGNFIKNDTGCMGEPITFTITVKPTLLIADTIQATNVTGTITACAGTSSASPNIQQFSVSGNGLTGNITATAPAGFEVSLSPASGYGSSVTLTAIGDSVSSTNIYARSSASAPPGIISGNVTLTSPGAAGQYVAVTGIINALVAPSVSITASANDICFGTPVTFTASAANGGSMPSYQWMVNKISVQNSPDNSDTYTDNQPADGDVISCTIISQAACAFPDTATSNNITLKINPLPVVNAGGPKTIKEGSSIVLNASATGNIADVTWSPALGLSNSKILNPKASPSSNTTYTLLVQTADGCTATDTATVTVFADIAIPNTFTPNGDGINDTWNIKYLNSYPNCTVGIYNRYGEKLYSSIGYGEPWDGRYKGVNLPQGTYYYIIDLKNGLKVLSGSVTIIR